MLLIHLNSLLAMSFSPFCLVTSNSTSIRTREKIYKRLDYSWPSVFKELLKFRVKKKIHTHTALHLHVFNHVSFIRISIEKKKKNDIVTMGNGDILFQSMSHRGTRLTRQTTRTILASVDTHTNFSSIHSSRRHKRWWWWWKENIQCVNMLERDMIDRFSPSLKVLPYMLWWPSCPLSLSCEVIKRKSELPSRFGNVRRRQRKRIFNYPFLPPPPPFVSMRAYSLPISFSPPFSQNESWPFRGFNQWQAITFFRRLFFRLNRYQTDWNHSSHTHTPWWVLRWMDVHFFFTDRPSSFFFNSISDERRNLRIDHQLVQSYSFDHLFVVLLLTMRDENTRSSSRECDKNMMTIHSLGSYYTYRWIFRCGFLSIRTYISELKPIENWRERENCMQIREEEKKVYMSWLICSKERAFLDEQLI